MNDISSIILVRCDSTSATFDTPAGRVELIAGELYCPMVPTSSSAPVSPSDLTRMRGMAGTACMLAALAEGLPPFGCAIRSAAAADYAAYCEEFGLRLRPGAKEWFRKALSNRGDYDAEVQESYWLAVQKESWNAISEVAVPF